MSEKSSLRKSLGHLEKGLTPEPGAEAAVPNLASYFSVVGGGDSDNKK
jgi:hypothetical protein